ncbi:hypothetical protein OAB15_03690 [Porticoccaceae bacterium]|nr:hypothetical protein [Porticoccaceae bacterium]
MIPGFEKLGCSVDYVSNFDPKRGYRVSIPLKQGSSKNFRRISGFVNSLLLPLKLKKNYDMIVMANPFVGTFLLSDWTLRMLRDRTQNLVWWITTCDTKMRVWEKSKDSLLCQRCNIQRGTLDTCPKLSDVGIEFDRRVELYADQIIPCALEYAEGRLSENSSIKIIPLSTSLVANQYLNVRGSDNNKLSFYHGANSIWKGSDVIGDAFSYGASKWDDKANFDLGKFVELKKYISLVAKQDVVVDQLYSKSFGVNALLVMQTGGLLLVGDTQKFETFNLQAAAPIVRLNGELNNLQDNIDNIMSNWSYYSEVRAHGPEYAKTYFSPTVIAQQFIERIKR